MAFLARSDGICASSLREPRCAPLRAPVPPIVYHERELISARAALGSTTMWGLVLQPQLDDELRENRVHGQGGFLYDADPAGLVAQENGQIGVKRIVSWGLQNRRLAVAQTPQLSP
jgi:hypothetical protein